MYHTNKISFRTVKWILIIIAAVILGVFVGRFITSYETQYLFSREYCGSYKDIDVYKCGEINGTNAAAHLRLLETVPDALAEACSAIYLTGGNLSVPIVGTEGGKALGLTQNTTVFISTDSFNVDVLYHELFHAYDNANGKLTSSEEFAEIVEAEGSMFYLEGYEESSLPEEVFASAGAMYMLEPEHLLFKAPMLYSYIDELIG
ncbi:MAG: hypothetical protein IJY73_04355 [Oscillospiraceae bacterium]|nr:hypothetical protein [Oscillospiraceae bacterium]